LSGAPSTNFDGLSSVPSGWTTSVWNQGGTITVANGALAADGAIAGTTAAFNSGSTLSFAADFTSSYQDGGFATDLSTANVAGFSTQAGGGLWAYAGGSLVQLNNSLLNGWHNYKIVWSGSTFTYFADGVQVAQLSWVTSNLNVQFGDLNLDGSPLAVDNVDVAPFTSTGSFTSRVLDAGRDVVWSNLVYEANVPTGATIALTYRTGETATPDGSWSGWISAANNATVGTTLALHPIRSCSLSQ